MSNPSDNIYNYVKTSAYPKRYVDRFDMSTDKVNPLLNVIPPTTASDFFGTRVCNLVCFTKPMTGWDASSVSASMTWFKSICDQFAVYETHFFIDLEADVMLSTPPSQITQMETEINQFISDYTAGAYGFTYEGKFNSADLKARILSVLAAFYQK